MICPNCNRPTQPGWDTCPNCKTELVAPVIGSIRDQVFETIVRQALAGAPWKEICSGPMQVNHIAPEQIEAEINRRKNISIYRSACQNIDAKKKSNPKPPVRLLIGIWLIAVTLSVLFRSPQVSLVAYILCFILYAGISGLGLLSIFAGVTAIAGAFAKQPPVIKFAHAREFSSPITRFLVFSAGLACFAVTFTILRISLSWLNSNGPF